jgi:hypothetical protein
MIWESLVGSFLIKKHINLIWNWFCASVAVEMDSQMDLEKFRLQWPALKNLMRHPGLLLNQTLEERIQTIGGVHSKFRILVKFYYKNCHSMDEEERRKFNSFQRKYSKFANFHRILFKQYFASIKQVSS